MQPTDDSAFLRRYVEDKSDDAFAALVAKHVNLVYSVALRHLGDPNQAEEITQVVFIILAKKAAQLRHEKALSSWLFQATHLTANNFVRSEMRRRRREQEAHMSSILNEPGSNAWEKIGPWLDSAVAGLNEKDRRAIVLRFYEGRNLREVGAALSTSEEAAKKRVTRAVEKLQRFFLKHGVASTAAAIAGAISANSVQAAPPTLAKSVTAIAITKGAAASGSTLTLIQGAAKIMAWTKTKTVIAASVALVLTAGVGLQTLALIKKHLLQQQTARRIVVPGAAWSNTGYAEPKSTLTTFLWAASQSDGEAILNSFTPDGQQHWQENFAKQMQSEGKSLPQILSQEVGGHFGMVLKAGFTIMDESTLADGRVLVRLEVPGDPKERAWWFKKINGEWKIDSFE